MYVVEHKNKEWFHTRARIYYDYLWANWPTFQFLTFWLRLFLWLSQMLGFSE